MMPASMASTWSMSCAWSALPAACCTFFPFLAWRSPCRGEIRRPALLPQVHELPPEAPLDAEVAAGHVVIDRRADLDDAFVLHVHGQGAADAAIGTDGVGGG